MLVFSVDKKKKRIINVVSLGPASREQDVFGVVFSMS